MVQECRRFADHDDGRGFAAPGSDGGHEKQQRRRSRQSGEPWASFRSDKRIADQRRGTTPVTNSMGATEPRHVILGWPSTGPFTLILVRVASRLCAVLNSRDDPRFGRLDFRWAPV